MYDLNVLFTSGGYHCCSPKWNSDPEGKDNHYKLYFVTEGSARINIDRTWHELLSGHIYFINASRLHLQRCDEVMKLYWLHFVPESLFVNMYLDNLKPVYQWVQEEIQLNMFDFTIIPHLFDRLHEQKKHIPGVPLPIESHIHSLVWMLLQDMIAKQNTDEHELFYNTYLKIKPAADHMDSNYKKNIKLKELSDRVYLNPSYFIRLFKKYFNMTPRQYIIKKRLNDACRLLLNSDKSIQEVSEKTGFCNAFYFSKVFKKNFGMPPSLYKRSRCVP